MRNESENKQEALVIDDKLEGKSFYALFKALREKCLPFDEDEGNFVRCEMMYKLGQQSRCDIEKSPSKECNI